AVQAELNKERAERNAEKANALITTALSEGKLLPAQKEWAENLAKTDLNALSAYLNATPVNPAFGENQSKAEPKGNVVSLSADEKEAARIMGKTEAEYIEIKKQQEAK
ncbi:phage protease, partial [Actinobacillus minor]|uniref:phage protease n=1 Tax=Actinobacillus minor TaxID=51047 RepID=UPI0023F15FA7